MVKPIENLLKRKLTGGRIKRFRARRASEKDGYAAESLMGPAHLYHRRTRGGSEKVSVKYSEFVNVFDPSTGKTQKSKISRVLRNPANRDYERRGVITKGAFLATEVGNVRVTSRPAQDGVVNAVLVAS